MLRPVHTDAVHGVLHAPDRPTGDALILTHGAGSNHNAPLLVALANAFSSLGWAVLRCDLPFRQKRPHGPPPRGSVEQDQAGLRTAVEWMRTQHSGHVYLGGHSYGGRQASMLASAHPQIAPALLLLSYPLHPPNKPAALRTEHLPLLRVPAFFVHGARDGFATPEELLSAVKLIPAKTKILEVEAAGHELLSRRNVQQLPHLMAEQFQEFV